MQVFSAFGFVHKITTFEKTAGFQVNELILFMGCGLFASALEISTFYNCYFAGIGAVFRFRNSNISKKCLGWTDYP